MNTLQSFKKKIRGDERFRYLLAGIIALIFAIVCNVSIALFAIRKKRTDAANLIVSTASYMTSTLACIVALFSI